MDGSSTDVVHSTETRLVTEKYEIVWAKTFRHSAKTFMSETKLFDSANSYLHQIKLPPIISSFALLLPNFIAPSPFWIDFFTNFPFQKSCIKPQSLFSCWKFLDIWTSTHNVLSNCYMKIYAFSQQFLIYLKATLFMKKSVPRQITRHRSPEIVIHSVYLLLF